MAAKKIGPIIHVIFDTSALFTEAADKLIAEEISEFVISTNTSLGLDVHWYLPGVVREERRFQMNSEAQKFLRPLERVERLLGHGLGVTVKRLETSVNEVLQREIERHSLQIHELDAGQVDWQDLIARAVSRKPPFDPRKDQEKGFRDAVILETLCQLLQDLPKALQSCRIVFVCPDGLLAQASRERIEKLDRSNVFLLSNLGDLKTMLNALASEVPQQDLPDIIAKASKIFFNFEQKSGLYYDEKVSEQIRTKHASVLANKPEKGFTTQLKNVFIAAPTLLKKRGQKLHFSSRIRYIMEASKPVLRTPTIPAYPPSPDLGILPSSPDLGGLLGSGGAAPSTGVGAVSTLAGPNFAGSLGGLPGLSSGLFAAVPGSSPEPQVEWIRRGGEHVFEVTWSATMTTHGKLTRAKVEQIEHKTSHWDEQP